jgi:prevent-host-death family protein
MPVIRPISDLRNKAREISDLVHKKDEPVFITRDGRGDMVVMSLAAWERQEARSELYRLIDEAEADERAGDTGISLKAMRTRLRRR